ncbi:MAG: hypothetical protein PHD43_20610 [Methylococcales bacterium]|nr:hypothetical protein [Methylococcales bacterium]
MCKAIRAALDKPDLPVSFVAESLASMAERCKESQPFVPRIRRELHDQFCKLDDFYGNIKNYKTAPLPMRILRSMR